MQSAAKGVKPAVKLPPGPSHSVYGLFEAGSCHELALNYVAQADSELAAILIFLPQPLKSLDYQSPFWQVLATLVFLGHLNYMLAPPDIAQAVKRFKLSMDLMFYPVTV